MAGLYIHIPFCSHACPYCDFSFELLKDGQVDRLLSALENEAEYRSQESPWPDSIINTIFLGGGTPTCLTERQFERVFRMIYQYFHIEPNAEITVEANPETVTSSKLNQLCSFGVNRLSIGVQSFSDDILDQLGRRHTADQAVQATKLARDVGFANINIDLMFGVPGQIDLDWSNTLDCTVSLAPEHVSIYGLTIEPGTVFARRREDSQLDLPDEALQVGYYYQAIDRLTAVGYQHYEISNLSKPGDECMHSLSCWNGNNYLGLGPSAHSHTKGRRFANTRRLVDYLSAIEGRGQAIDLDETLTNEERIHEHILLNLRSIKGLDILAFRKHYGAEAMEKRASAIHALTEEGLLEKHGSQFRLTRRGLALADSVCEYLM